jgi:hypothetical protein
MRAEADLLTLQRRFMAALGEPIYGDSRARSELPARSGEVSAVFTRTADDLITPSALLAPVERLELYHRQYWYRLLDSIAEDFPALRRLLGDEAFWRLMEAYLEAMPPVSFTLRHLGAGLADFIAERAADVSRAVHAEELARIEYALCQAFEAGETRPVDPSEVRQGRLALQPHVHLLALRTNGDTLWRAAGRGRRPAKLGPPSAEPRRFVVVYRHDFGLHVERIPRAAFAILSAIRELGSLERAIEKVTDAQGLLRARDAGRVTDWFGLWTVRGWLTRPLAPPAESERREP